MSGGSHGYLFMSDEVADLAGKMNHLVRMADDLARASDLPHADRAERDTRSLLHALRMVIPEDLCDVWKAMEWWHSSDGGPEEVIEALGARYGGASEPAEASWPEGATVGDLRAWLAQFPDDHEVDLLITRRIPGGTTSAKAKLNRAEPNPMHPVVNLEARVGLG